MSKNLWVMQKTVRFNNGSTNVSYMCGAYDNDYWVREVHRALVYDNFNSITMACNSKQKKAEIRDNYKITFQPVKIDFIRIGTIDEMAEKELL